MNAQHRQAARDQYRQALRNRDRAPEDWRPSMVALTVVWASLVLLIVTFWVAVWWVVAWVVESVWRIVQSGGSL